MYYPLGLLYKIVVPTTNHAYRHESEIAVGVCPITFALQLLIITPRGLATGTLRSLSSASTCEVYLQSTGAPFVCLLMCFRCLL